MKTFVDPIVTVESADPSDKAWMDCTRAGQVFLLCLSFTVIHHITNPFRLADETMLVLTAAVTAVECAVLIIVCSFFCIRLKAKKGEAIPVDTSTQPTGTNFHIHPMYFI